MTQAFAMADATHSSRNAAVRSQAPASQIHTNPAFEAVFESSGEALVLIDSTGAIHRANRRARDLLRLKNAAARHLDLGEFISQPSAEQLASLWIHRPAAARPQAVDASLASGFSVRITLRSILPGSHDLLLCIEEGSIVRRAEAKWRQTEAELRSVLDSVQAGVILLDPSGRVRFSNDRFAQLFGLDARQLDGIGGFEELEAMIAEGFRNPAAFAAPWKSYVAGAGEPVHDELDLVRPSRRVLARFSRPVLDSGGRPLGWLELYSDVTGERQIQAKMLQTEKMAALGQLVSGIAHELNNPLTTIMGYAQLMLGHGLDPQQMSEAKQVYQEAGRARSIVKNLLYFARENKPERSRVDLNEIVERTLALRSYELKVKDISVECELAPGLPHTTADPYQLQQVVLNLLVNAEQALLEGRGRGHVWIRTTHIVHGLGSHSRDSLVLEVSDDGPGISPEIASRIFDPFFTTKPPGIGTGLGLSIVYGIVHQHGGEVTFENQPGKGACFVVELPVVAAPAAEQKPALASFIGRTAISPARILVVEDEPTVAQLVVDVLREVGHKVEAVLDSQQGLSLLSRSHYDLVICDLRMPRLDGRGFYDALVRAGSKIKSRIIFITGDTLDPEALDFLEQNRLPYLAKPFLVEELQLAVNAALCAADYGSKPVAADAAGKSQG
jgi:two-component system, NtrC family, sensor kinase